MPVSSVTEHWIRQDALTINLNHFGDPDYLQVSLLAGAVVMAFKQDVIGYNAAHNYRTWPLEAANTYLETTSAYHVYAKLSRSEVNSSALIAYDPILRDINGCEITYDNNGNEQLGEPSQDLFYIYMGKISSSLDASGHKVKREWIDNFKTGSLDTSQQKNELYDLSKLFEAHYDDPLSPDKLTWIEAKSHLGVKGGITSYATDDSEIPTIAEELPYDKKTIWLNPETGKIEVIGGTGGGGGSILTKEEIIDMGFNLGSEDVGIGIEESSEEYATKGYVDKAISNIGGVGGGEPLTIKDSTGLEEVVYDGKEAKELTLTKGMVGLDNVENIPDSDRYVGYARGLKNSKGTVFASTILVGSDPTNKFGRSGEETWIDGKEIYFHIGQYGYAQPYLSIREDGSVRVIQNLSVGKSTAPEATLDVEGDARITEKLTVKELDVDSFKVNKTIGIGNVSLTEDEEGNLEVNTNVKVQGEVSSESVDVGGIKLTKLEDGVLKLDGHLVVTEGLTTYSTDEVPVSNEVLQSLIDRISALESEVERLKNG